MRVGKTLRLNTTKAVVLGRAALSRSASSKPPALPEIADRRKKITAGFVLTPQHETRPPLVSLTSRWGLPPTVQEMFRT